MYERGELSRGTYEIVATKEYMVRAPQPVIHVFCIDVSQPAIASGATAATCQCIEQVLDSLQGAQDHAVLVASARSSESSCACQVVYPLLMATPYTSCLCMAVCCICVY